MKRVVGPSGDKKSHETHRKRAEMPRQASTNVRGNTGPPRVKSTEFLGGGPSEGRGPKRAGNGAERQEREGEGEVAERK